MVPVAFRIPFLELDVPGYGLALTIGFLLSVAWAVRRATRSGANPDVVLNCAFIALIGGVVGARAMYVVHYPEQVIPANAGAVQTLLAVVNVRQGGLEVYGGVLLAAVTAVGYLLVRRHSLRWYLDIIAPSLALGMGLGRIGCFLNGCCWGHQCDLPWGVRFPFGSNAMIEQWYDGRPGLELPQELINAPPHGMLVTGESASPLPRDVLLMKERDVEKYLPVWRELKELVALQAQAKTSREQQEIARRAARLGCQADTAQKYGLVLEALDRHGLSLAQLQELARPHRALPVHPTQLYSTIVLVLLALFLSALYWRRTRDGQVICAFMVLEPWSRYLLEIIRADNPQDTFSMTVSQFIGALLVVTGVVGWLVLQRLPARSVRAVRWEPEVAAAAEGADKAGRPARGR